MNERELRRAFDDGELRLFFQPVVRAATGRMVGAEALVRWQHPTLGLLAPAEFLPLAARVGLLDRIGAWVVDEAIAQRATWPDATFVSVNLSPIELASANATGLAGRISRACARAGVAPADVWVEVTEQPILAPEATRTVLTSLHDLGVRVVLDDFGSGHASLTRLRDLPFDVCKLDRSFTAGMAGKGGIRVVRAAMAVARAFGTEVVAEGVENAEQLAQLDALGCDLLQGYHVARPAPADAVRELLWCDADRPAHRTLDALAPSPPADACGATGRDHRVLYYDGDDTLVTWVVDALRRALEAGDPVVTVATAEHRRRFVTALRSHGVDVAAAVASGQLVQVDAETSLALVVEDGVMVAERLTDLIEGLLPTGGRPCVFGEMVGLLWTRGDVAEAMALEEAWNASLDERALTLLCAYPSAEVAAAHQDGLQQVAQHHSHVSVGDQTWQVDSGRANDPIAHVRELRSALAATALAVGAQARLEAELADLQRRVDASERFGAMVVHELRNPAAVLSLALESLRGEGDELSRPETEHLLELASASAGKVERLAAELLLAAKLQAAEFTAGCDPFDLASTVRAAVERTRLVTGHPVHQHTPTVLPALGDDDRQRQILINLLDNAVAVSPPDAPVRIAVATEGGEFVVRVRDAGPGIRTEDRHRLFEPFTRIEATARPTGTGLGLHIVARLVERQGGRIWVEDAPGGGAVFVYTVPRVAEDDLGPRGAAELRTTGPWA